MSQEVYVAKLKEMGWPQEFGEKVAIGDLKSNVGIATLWSYNDLILKGLDKGFFAVLGNYYDRRNALEPFIRNCLANPNIRYVIIVGNDRAKSKEVLLSFFEKGVDEKGLVSGTEVPAPRGIPLEDINKLRENVELIDITDQIKDQNDSDEYVKAITETVEKLSPKEPYDEPKLYDKPPLETDSFPAEKSGMVVHGKTIGETWLKLLHNIYNYGAVTKMKTGDSTQVREMISFVAVVDGEDPDEPMMQPYFRFDEEYLKSYYDEICTAKIPEGTLYTYGSRLRGWEGPNNEKIDQVADMIEYLKKDTYRKSALAQTWIVEDELTRRYLNKDKNSPCIILVQPNIQDGVLYLTVYIRSNDMFRAWPLNAFGLRKLQKIIAQGLGVDMGSLITISCSAHIYQDNWEDTKNILKEYYKEENTFSDPRGYYTIGLNKGKIKVEHYSPDSQLLKEYVGMSARELNNQINASQHPSTAFHSSYLGEELMKAQLALERGIAYTQDAPLNFGSAPAANTCDDGAGVCSDETFTTQILPQENQTYLELEIQKFEQKFNEHIAQVNAQGKDLFAHWKKPAWDEYFMSMAVLIAMRSIDPSQKNGCVIVGENKTILSLGYNGFPAGSDDASLPLTRPEKYMYIEHAEKNAILNKQFSIAGSTAYTTAYPCVACLRSIIQSGIKRVVYLDAIKSRNISTDEQRAVENLLKGRTDITLEKFEQDPLQCLFKAVEYYKIKNLSAKK